ncbi:hypothetical protein BC938DRAFT_476550 [Jimgerdemannia flammicorona]|uniref:Uncharacterized protein n=1 Tax=Jimgerdemannia flammicorona TaxID=994334 RepID=A0A433QQB9_9FUNG|nr:hypothetical protein BC938DRAFT_476550 [Jimgerdemannia flammicorona]
MSILSYFNAPAPTRASAHPWPQPQSAILIAGLFSLWWAFTSPDAKLRAIFGAGLICTLGKKTFVPFTTRFKEGETTRYQFFGNIIAIPFFIDNFEAVIPTRFLRIALFPFNFWAMEMTMGYIFIYLNGYNPAWAFRRML